MMKTLNEQETKSLTISEANRLADIQISIDKTVWKDDFYKWVTDNWTSRGEPLDFTEHAYLKQIYQDQHPFLVMMKSAQTGATERGLTEALWIPDQTTNNSIYFFPTSGTISDLVQERVDDPLNNKKYLRQVSGRAKKIMGKQADKIGLKRMSHGFIYFRGSNKPTQITSIAGDAIFVDELDRMIQENVPYFAKRLAHSKLKWQRWFSTPTIPNFGIHKLYLTTDQQHYHITCSECGEHQELDFYTNVEFEMVNEIQCKWAKLVCIKCRKEIVPWKCKGEWIAQNPESDRRGYFLSKMYSPTTDFKEMVEASKRSAEWEVQQFHNQDLGKPYEPKGGRVTEEMMHSCIRDYTLGLKEGDNFMGIDVGLKLHVIIQNSKKKVVNILTIKDFEDLDKLMDEYDIKKAVMDALPETRKAQEFANRFRGRVHLCYYSGLKEVKKDEWYKIDDEAKWKVNTDRTLSLDMWSARFRNQGVYLPKNLDDYIEFKSHMGALTRAIVKDSKGNETAQYLQTGPDHLYHAGNYSNIARDIFDKVDEPEAFIL